MNRHILSAALSALLAILLSMTTASARILNVPADYHNIQTGVNAAESGDTLLLEAGVYHDSVSIDNKSLTIGSWTMFDGDSSHRDETVIDGRREFHPFNIQNCSDNGVDLIGLTVRNGSARRGGGNIPSSSGGAIYANRSNLHIDHCLFDSNAVNIGDGEGGAIWSAGCSLYVHNSNFFDDSASYDAGAIYVGTDTFLEMTNCTLNRNSTAGSEGGAIDGMHSTIIMNNIEMVENRVDDWSGYGGAINLWDCAVTIDRLNCSRNWARYTGTAIYMTQCRNVVINHGTFVENTGYRGIDDTAAVIHCWGGNITIKNSILWNNSILEFRDADAFISYSDMSGGRNRVRNDRGSIQWGDGVFDADPRFHHPDNGDYRLWEESPCIDTGDPNDPDDANRSRTDIGYAGFIEREIALDRQQIVFPARTIGSLDSQVVLIRNVGGTDLTVSSFRNMNQGTCFWFNEDTIPNPPKLVGPYSLYRFKIFFNLEENRATQTIIQIGSDDADEPVLELDVCGSLLLSVKKDSLIPTHLNIHPLSPNPFNSSTTIRFGLDKSAPTRLTIFGLDGRLVSELARGRMSAGEHSVVWNAEGVPAGVYIVRLEGDRGVRTTKAVLLK